MQEEKIKARVWLIDRFPGLPDLRVPRDVASLSELSRCLPDPVSAAMLADREFRKRAGITLMSEQRDRTGAVVCEMDIIAVGNPNRSENYHILRYGWMGDTFTLHRVGDTMSWNEGTAANCTRIASYHENPSLYARLANTHLGL